jgi:hypothetical protein
MHLLAILSFLLISPVTCWISPFSIRNDLITPTMFPRHYKFRTTVSSASATDVQETTTIIDTCTLTLFERVQFKCAFS